MAPRGIAEWYFTKHLPSRAVSVAHIDGGVFTPADLVDVNNTPYQQGTLGVWKSTSVLTNPPDFLPPDYGQSVAISNSTLYYVSNQYYQITNQAVNGVPLYYGHPLPQGVSAVSITDLSGATQQSTILISNQILYHDLSGGPFQVHYSLLTGFLVTEMLQFNPAMREGVYSPAVDSYITTGRLIQVASNGTYYIRFTRPNGYRVLPPYNSLPNTPWFARISYSLTPVAPEWPRQVFLPRRPYVLASWVPGIVIGANFIEFDRKNIYYDGSHLPDVLVFDSKGNIKYALDGTAPGSPRRRGNAYPWKRGLIKEGIDVTNARVEVLVPLSADDVVYGFFSYKEPDVLYSAVDINPFTNPHVRNAVVRFYFKSDGADPFHYIYHQILDSTGSPIAGQTNDPSPSSGTNIPFSDVVVGATVNKSRFVITDSRSRGGGLLEEWRDKIPDAVNFFDSGYWDGKPYPAAGVLIIHLPQSILNVLPKEDVQAKVESIVPIGVIPVIFFYSEDGSETR